MPEEEATPTPQPPGPALPPARDEERRLLSGPHSRGSEFLRVIRIAAEFITGFRKLHFVGACVTVFGSARFKEGHPYYELAREIGRELANAGFTVMTGGGPGLMEAANRGAREAGGRSIGCNIQLPQEQLPNAYLDEWITFRHFYVRKVMLVKYSYAFVALPGGYGTFDEIFEAATLIQTGKIRDFPIVLIGREYWTPLLDVLRDRLLAEGTIEPEDLQIIQITDSPQEAAKLIGDVTIGRFGLSYTPKLKRRRVLFE